MSQTVKYVKTFARCIVSSGFISRLPVSRGYVVIIPTCLPYCPPTTPRFPPKKATNFLIISHSQKCSYYSVSDQASIFVVAALWAYPLFHQLHKDCFAKNLSDRLKFLGRFRRRGRIYRSQLVYVQTSVIFR